MATATWAAAGVVTTTDGAEAVVIITDGPGAAVTAITGKLSLDSLIAIPLPGRSGELQRRERVAPMRRGRFSGHRTAERTQPSPISTAIRIRSE
jgi:hypothetical protein